MCTRTTERAHSRTHVRTMSTHHGKRVHRQEEVARFPPGAFPATMITLLAALNTHAHGMQRRTAEPACPGNTSTTPSSFSSSLSGVVFDRRPTMKTRRISCISWYFETRRTATSSIAHGALEQRWRVECCWSNGNGRQKKGRKENGECEERKEEGRTRKMLV